MHSSIFISAVILFWYLANSCSGFPKPQEEVSRAAEPRAEQAGGLGSALSGFQSGMSSFMNASNMKESKMVIGGFSFIIVPSPDMSQFSQMSPGQIPQLPSLPGGR